MWYNSYATVHFVMPTWHSGSIGLEPGAIAWSDSLERQQVRAQQTKGAHCNSRDNRLPWIFSYVYIFIFTDGRHPIYIYCMIQNMNMILWCEYHRIHVHVGSSTSSIPGSCRLWRFRHPATSWRHRWLQSQQPCPRRYPRHADIDAMDAMVKTIVFVP